jgi:ankyrin repeat protein
MIFLLCVQRSDPRQADSKGDTPLHICVREGYAHGSWLLINYLGLACLHVKNNLGQTPLDVLKQFDASKKSG